MAHKLLKTIVNFNLEMPMKVMSPEGTEILTIMAKYSSEISHSTGDSHFNLAQKTDQKTCFTPKGLCTACFYSVVCTGSLLN